MCENPAHVFWLIRFRLLLWHTICEISHRVESWVYDYDFDRRHESCLPRSEGSTKVLSGDGHRHLKMIDTTAERAGRAVKIFMTHPCLSHWLIRQGFYQRYGSYRAEKAKSKSIRVLRRKHNWWILKRIFWTFPSCLKRYYKKLVGTKRL